MCYKNLFSYLRMMGGGPDHPTPVQLQNCIKWYILLLEKHSACAISRKENTGGDSSCFTLININDTSNLNNSTCSQFLTDENSRRKKNKKCY